MPNSLILLCVLIVVVVSLKIVFRRSPVVYWEEEILVPFDSREESILPYRKRSGLFSKAEINFLRSLEAAVDDRFRVFGKVRMEDVLEVAGVSGKEWASARGRIKARHVDYVLCDARSLEIVAAIELDDASHQSPKAKEADEFKNRAFEAAKLPLLRFEARAGYLPATVRERIDAVLGSGISSVSNQESVKAGVPEAIATNEEFRRISALHKDGVGIVLNERPSAALYQSLKDSGYSAERMGRSWVWSRN